jgi:hypothetical protein
MEKENLNIREKDNHVLHAKFATKAFINIVIEKH